MKVSLSESLKAFVDGQVEHGGYKDASAYICDLVRKDQQRVIKVTVRQLIAEGLASGHPALADTEYWANKRQKLDG